MFLDTSGLLCIYEPKDELHLRAVDYFRAQDYLVTTSYVLLELVSLMVARRIAQDTMLRFVRGIEQSRRIEILWVDQGIHQSGMDRLARRLDKIYTLCDAVSFVLMESRGITEALTTDRHFEQEGFTRLLK